MDRKKLNEIPSTGASGDFLLEHFAQIAGHFINIFHLKSDSHLQNILRWQKFRNILSWVCVSSVLE